MCRDHASQCGREFRPHGNLALALVCEVKELADDLLAALLLVKSGRFEHRTIPLDKAVAPRHLPPLRKDIVPNGAVIRQKIAESGQCLHQGRFCRARPSRTIQPGHWQATIKGCRPNNGWLKQSNSSTTETFRLTNTKDKHETDTNS